MPHSTYTVSPEHLLVARDLAENYNLPFCTHACETNTEVNTVKNRYGLNPIEQLHRLNLVHDHSILAHCVHLSEKDIELLANQQSLVAHCSLSNLKLGSGIAPLPEMQQAGVCLALGTDGPVGKR
ncbi:MAG: amidohydrolase family protein [Deinococcales bacterium]